MPEYRFSSKHRSSPVWQQQCVTPVQQMISSCTGALVTSLFVTPLDVVKIRLQAQQKEFLRNKCFLYCNGIVEELCCCVNRGSSGALHSSYWYRPPVHFTGTVDAFVKISRTEGISSLWSGLPPTLIMAVPATVIYFTMYDQLKGAMMKWLQTPYQPFWVPVIAGGSARAIAATVMSPLELVRTKMQSKKLSYFDIGVAIRNLVQNQGFLALWRGWGPTVLRDVPFSSLYWASYEYLKYRFQQQHPTFWFSFYAGATAGVMAAVLTLPFDVIKTHRQIELGESEGKLVTKNFSSSTCQLMKILYQSQGVKALFTGLVPRVVKVAPACAIMISTYEYGKHFFHQYNLVRKTESNLSCQ